MRSLLSGLLSISAQKRTLIQNGTYREDGTVNLETARRLGWDRMWEELSTPAVSPNP